MSNQRDLSIKKISYDRDEDIMWIVFKSGEEDDYLELAPGINAELDNQGNLIGLEIFDYSKKFIKDISWKNDVHQVPPSSYNLNPNINIASQQFNSGGSISQYSIL